MVAAESLQAQIITDIRQVPEQEAACQRLIQQSVSLLGFPPEKLYPGLVQAVEARVRAEFDHRTTTTTATQASPAEHLPVQLHISPANKLMTVELLVPTPAATCVHVVSVNIV